MRFSNQSRYALRATLALAKSGKDGSPVSINNLSEQEQISAIFLEQIFFKLRKAGLLSSVRGSGGGFYFTRPLDKVTLKEILDAVGEDIDTISCDKHNNRDCQRMNDCLSHRILLEMTNILNDFLKNVTLASVLEKYDFKKMENNSLEMKQKELL